MPYIVYNEDGQRVAYLEDDEGIQDWLDSLPDDYYMFPIGGREADVQRFMLRLNAQVGGNDSFFDLLKAEHGRVPLQINPFDAIRKHIFGQNAFFVKLKPGAVDMDMLGQLFTVLHNTLSAGSRFFLIQEPEAAQDSYELDVEEQVEVFCTPETAAESEFDEVREHVTASTVI